MPIGDDFYRRLKEILSCPTAPFHEERVHRAILDAVEASGRLRARSDALGNLEVVYGKGRPRLLFTCQLGGRKRAGRLRGETSGRGEAAGTVAHGPRP